MLGRRKLREACVAVLSVTQFEDHHADEEEEQPLECELQGDDLDGSKGYIRRMVRVQGLPRGWAKNNGIESSVTTIFAKGSDIDYDTDELIIPADVEVVLGRSGNKGGRNGNRVQGGASNSTNVVKKVLVLRVVAQDSETTAKEAQLANNIFGDSGDPLNLQSQYKACSYDQLQFNAVRSNTEIGTDGVYTVYLPTTNITGASKMAILAATVNEATVDLGDLTSIADHVMVCLPPGTNGSWVAHAYVNHWLSVYNNNYCLYPSPQMHEIGHNLGLAHAGKFTNAYGDQSGIMGYSYGSEDTPKMCFNGPKSWQLGWYSQFHVDLPDGDFNWSGDLVGFAEKGAAAASDKMIIRIQNDFANNDTYVHFNRQIGMNSETKEGGDQVLVSTRTGGVDYAPSNLTAKLNASGVYTINDIGGSGDALTITVNSINTSSTPARAKVSIQLVPKMTDDLVVLPPDTPVVAQTNHLLLLLLILLPMILVLLIPTLKLTRRFERTKEFVRRARTVSLLLTTATADPTPETGKSVVLVESVPCASATAADGNV